MYASGEWKSLPLITRAGLIPVAEGLKRGAIVNGNSGAFLHVLRMAGMSHETSYMPALIPQVFTVGRPEALREKNERLVSLPGAADHTHIHRVYGWFFSYPECCVEEYVRPRSPTETRMLGTARDYLAWQFGRELDAEIRNCGRYPEEMDYRPLTFTPCSLRCGKALMTLRTWKDAIDRLDSEAAAELVYLNRSGRPQCYVHADYLMKESARRRMDHGIL